MAVAAAEQARPTMVFCAKEAVRLTLTGVAKGIACDGCPRYRIWRSATSPRAAGTWSARSVSTPRHLDDAELVSNARLGGTVPLWEWIGDEAATTFSY